MTPAPTAARRVAAAPPRSPAARAGGADARAGDTRGRPPAGTRGRNRATETPGRNRTIETPGRTLPGTPRRGGRRPSYPADRSARPEKRVSAPGRRAAVPVVGGVVWAALVLGATGAAAVVAAIVVIPVAVVAAGSGVRALEAARGRRGRRRHISPLALVAVTGAVVVPLAALAATVVAVAALAALAAAVLLLGGPAGAHRSSRHANGPATTGPATRGGPGQLGPAAGRLVAAVGPAAAAGSVLLARHQHASGALALLAAVLAFDAGAFMMGNARTATGGPVGVVFGLVSVAVVAVSVAALMNPPFSGARPWAVFAVVGLLAAAGVWLADRAVGGSRSPALRRLDSLILAGPAWVILMAAIH